MKLFWNKVINVIEPKIDIGYAFIPTPRSSGMPPFSSCHYEVISICTKHQDCFLTICVGNDSPFRLRDKQIELLMGDGALNGYCTKGDTIRSYIPYEGTTIWPINSEILAKLERYARLERKYRQRVIMPDGRRGQLYITPAEFEEYLDAATDAYDQGPLSIDRFGGFPIVVTDSL